LLKYKQSWVVDTEVWRYKKKKPVVKIELLYLKTNTPPAGRITDIYEQPIKSYNSIPASLYRVLRFLTFLANLDMYLGTRWSDKCHAPGEIWGSHGSEDGDLLICDAMYTCR
jgi:hypothetical protein